MKIAVVGSEYLESYLNEIQSENVFAGNITFMHRLTDPFRYNHYEIAKDLERNNVDIVVSGPHDNERLSNHTKIPQIILTLSVVDILSSFRQIVDNNKTCIILNSEMNENVELSEQFIQQMFHKAHYKRASEIPQIIERFRQEGFDTFIGNYLVTVQARAAGAKGIYYYSKKGLLDTIHHAILQVDNLRREKEYVTDIKAILDRTFNGVITSTTKGEITYANTSAYSVLKVENQNLVGKNLSQFIPQNILDNLVITEQSEESVQFTTNQTRIIGNFIAKKGYDDNDEWCFIFENSSKIMELEGEIRRHIKKSIFSAKYTFDDIVGNTPEIKNTIEKAKIFSRNDATVMIYGETGTGKEVFAQSIHNASDRASYPFVAINCGAIPDTLIESELFGYETGSFTGASSKGKVGLIELAHRGTVFLDDIDSISLGFQSKILRVIQEREILRIGAQKPHSIDVRFIVATNKSLLKLVQDKQFRSDLYYRLNVLTLALPPLIKRKADIELLLRFYLQQFNRQFYSSIEDKFCNIFFCGLSYNFPGNVRELIAIVERFTTLVDPSRHKDTEYLCKLVADCIFPDIYTTQELSGQFEFSGDYQQDLRAAQKRIIEKYISNFGGSISETAKKMGISRASLYQKIRELDILY